MNRSLAPIVLFVYNRPEHLEKTISSLRNNFLAEQSKLFIYSDGPKKGEESSVRKVREIANNVSGFNKVKVFQNKTNLGLSKSIISGVSEVVKEYKKVIVLEDDLIFSKDYLSFMNSTLNYYQNENKVMSVGGYSFSLTINPSYKYDVYHSYRTVSWGWGTWKNSWEKADWDLSECLKFLDNKEKVELFSRGGSDLPYLLRHQMRGLVDSWSIRWDVAHCINDSVTVLPIKTRVLNIGQDGSGTHCNRIVDPENILYGDSLSPSRYPQGVLIERSIVEQIHRMHGSKIVNFLKYQIKNLINKGI